MKRTRIIISKDTTIHIDEMTEREKQIFEAATEDGFQMGLMLGIFACIVLSFLLGYFLTH